MNEYMLWDIERLCSLSLNDVQVLPRDKKILLDEALQIRKEETERTIYTYVPPELIVRLNKLNELLNDS